MDREIGAAFIAAIAAKISRLGDDPESLVVGVLDQLLEHLSAECLTDPNIGPGGNLQNQDFDFGEGQNFGAASFDQDAQSSFDRKSESAGLSPCLRVIHKDQGVFEFPGQHQKLDFARVQDDGRRIGEESFRWRRLSFPRAISGPALTKTWRKLISSALPPASRS
jgi:hypothetical protein